jgi:hypothetical protein
MVCFGGEDGCPARQRWCLCGVLACIEHGHTAYGDDFYCVYLNLGPSEVVPEPRRRIEDLDLSRWTDQEGH